MTDLTTILDDYALRTIARVLPSPLDASLRAISVRMRTLIEKPARFDPIDLMDEGARQGSIMVMRAAQAAGALLNSDVAEIIATGGHLDALRWICAQMGRNKFCEGKFCRAAARNGHLDILKWYHASFPEAPLDYCALAAGNGHLEVLQWLHANGAPLNFFCFSSAEFGHADVVRWLCDHDCPRDEMALSWVASLNDLSILQYAHSRDDTHAINVGCAYVAARLGNMPMLRWVLDQGCPLNEGICQAAAKGGQLAILQWLRALDGPRGGPCPWNAMCCERAAESNHFELLQWLHANGCPWDDRTCAMAAMVGNLDMLKWLRANDCPWDEWTCAYAAGQGHLHILQWAREELPKASRAPWSELACSTAAGHGHLHIVQWLRERGCPWNYASSQSAAAGGHLAILQWMFGLPENQRCPMSESMMAGVILGSHIDVVKWLYDESVHPSGQAPMRTRTHLAQCAPFARDPKIMHWLRAQQIIK